MPSVTVQWEHNSRSESNVVRGHVTTPIPRTENEAWRQGLRGGRGLSGASRSALARRRMYSRVVLRGPTSPRVSWWHLPQADGGLAGLCSSQSGQRRRTGKVGLSGPRQPSPCLTAVSPPTASGGLSRLQHAERSGAAGGGGRTPARWPSDSGSPRVTVFCVRGKGGHEVSDHSVSSFIQRCLRKHVTTGFSREKENKTKPRLLVSVDTCPRWPISSEPHDITERREDTTVAHGHVAFPPGSYWRPKPHEHRAQQDDEGVWVLRICHLCF